VCNCFCFGVGGIKKEGFHIEIPPFLFGGNRVNLNTVNHFSDGCSIFQRYNILTRDVLALITFYKL